MSAIELAKGERRHQEALAQHAAAIEQVQQNAARLTETRTRMDEITHNRVNSNATATEAAEFAALQGDTALLEKMMRAAEQAAEVAGQNMHQAFIYFTDAKRAHDREQAVAKFEALKAQCQEIESVFLQALGAVGRAGQAIGISTLGQAYPKSNAIRQVFDLNIIPTEGA